MTFTTTARTIPHVGAPSFARARRALIRLRAARLTDRMVREMVAAPGVPTRPHDPAFPQLDALAERYEALGGDRSVLLR
jgi:hypothetical protein